MNILIAYYSRSGHTAALADYLREEFQSRGLQVTMECILPATRPGKWRLVPPLWSALPLLPLILWLPPFRRWWLRHYPQPQQAIRDLIHPDVSGFDRVCIGGPKWLYIAYPVATYLATVKGLAGKRVGTFTTFCGPPLEVFELEMVFSPMAQRIRSRGASLAASLAISSHFHEFFFFREMEYVFRLVSRLRFRRPLRSFTLDSPWGRQEIDKFCKAVMQEG